MIGYAQSAESEKKTSSPTRNSTTGALITVYQLALRGAAWRANGGYQPP